MIESYFLKMHFAQLIRAWKISKYNSYSDEQKQIYHENLSSLFSILKGLDFDELSESEKIEIRDVMDFFILSLSFLNNSTINSVPYELVECLKYAMKDWMEEQEHDKFIIATSYNQYSFDPTLVTSPMYSVIETKFNINFETKLIQINLPKYLDRDYLANAVLYHELGHFIDQVKTLSPLIEAEIYNHYRSNPDCIQYFPRMPKNYWEVGERLSFLRHIQEYFADLFAAQYLKEASCYYLSYAAKDHPTSATHPSTENRIALINEFLNNGSSSNKVIEIFNEVTEKQTGKNLSVRCSDIDSGDLLKLIPYEITNKGQLHSLFVKGWNTWINDQERFHKENNMNETLKPSQIYQIINNLIEKSINNFIVCKQWEKSKTTVLI